MEEVVLRKELRPGGLADNHFVDDVGSCKYISSVDIDKMLRCYLS